MYKEEALACYTTFDLLPLFAKWSLRDSRWWTYLVRAKTVLDYTFMDQMTALQPLQCTDLISSLGASYFPNTVHQNKYMHMWWSVQQAGSELHAAFIPRVIELVEDITR